MYDVSMIDSRWVNPVMKRKFYNNIMIIYYIWINYETNFNTDPCDSEVIFNGATGVSKRIISARTDLGDLNLQVQETPPLLPYSIDLFSICRLSTVVSSRRAELLYTVINIGFGIGTLRNLGFCNKTYFMRIVSFLHWILP